MENNKKAPKSNLFVLFEDTQAYLQAKLSEAEKYAKATYKGQTVPSCYTSGLSRALTVLNEEMRRFRREDELFAQKESAALEAQIDAEILEDAELLNISMQAKNIESATAENAKLKTQATEIEKQLNPNKGARSKSGENPLPANADILEASFAKLKEGLLSNKSLIEKTKAALIAAKDKIKALVESFKARGIWAKVVKLRAGIVTAWELVKDLFNAGKEVVKEAQNAGKEILAELKEAANNESEPTAPELLP